MRVLRLAEPRAPWIPAPAHTLAPGEADVWLFKPSSPDAVEAAERLSEEERARAERLRRPEHRLRFSAVRGTVRTILSRYLDVDPLEVPIVYGPQGKPHVSPRAESEIRFNVSHSGALAAVAVTLHDEVGVDVELRVPRPRLPALADAMLAPPERAWFERLSGGERTRAFFDLWSAKEACSKLIGRGLTMPFNAVTLATPEAEVSEVRVDHASARQAPCFVRRLPVDAGYSGALAVEVVAAPRRRIATEAGCPAGKEDGD